MSISYEKIQATLEKINVNQKKVFAESIMKRISFADEDNMVDQIKRITAMKESFILLDKKTKENSVEVYQSIVDNLSNAITEHAKILIDHAKEMVEKL